jgi:hypothetical protein
MPSADALTPAPDNVQDLAQSCVRFVTAALGAPLDFSQDTLPLLDHYIRNAAGAEDEVLGLVVPSAGAYFGEVVRGHLGLGRWVAPSTDYERFRLEIFPGPLSFNPVGVALECATKELAAGWAAELKTPEAHRAAVDAALEAMGQVREDDFYTFSVRLEAIEVAHAHLTRLAAN